jgi:hypothetical protein
MHFSISSGERRSDVWMVGAQLLAEGLMMMKKISLSN